MLIAQSAWAFTLVKYVGAAYLVYLGVRMLVRRSPADALIDFDIGVREEVLDPAHLYS